jgi:hypothetical protein
MAKIDILDNLIKIFEERAKEKGFADVSSYINMVLENVAQKLEGKKQTSLTDEQEELVRNRLRKLGYID